MTHVHYKFSSKLSSDTVVFDGPHITLRDLKRQIMGREKLRAADCDLQITNAQTKAEYTDDEGMIPKGSSVIVRRIPIIGVKSGSTSKTHNTERSGVQFHHTFGAIKAMDDQSSSRALPLFSKMANLADADVSEEDKLKVLLSQTIYDTMNINKKFGAVVPANYTCYRCGNAGHHIRNCPTSGGRAEHDKNVEAPLRLKKSTGIPRSFMVEVDDPNIKGAMLTNCGHYAIPAIHAKAYAIGKKEKPPFVPQEQPDSEEEEVPVPKELLCPICRDLLSDAVVIPCCGNSYCDDCIRTALLDSEDHICPTCSQIDVSPDTLIANKFIRQAVNTYEIEQGHTKSLRGRRGTSQSQNPTPTPSPVPTPPPLTVQSQPQRPHPPTRRQQDPLLQHSQAAETPSSSQVCGASPTATGPAPASSTPSTSLLPVPSPLEISDKEAEKTTHDDSAAAAPSALVSHQDTTAAASQLIPVVNDAPAVEQPQTVSVNLQQSSSGPAPRQPGPSARWDSSSSSSGCPTTGWSESDTQQLPPSSCSSSYPVAPPPLFPSPHFHTFLATQQALSRYPPGYPPATPIWTLQTSQGAPNPSLCSSTSVSSIPTLINKEWYMHQRKKNEGSPHRGSAYRHSSSRSNSKSSKSKSSRSYSGSSSRSRTRSRSRSQGRSRHHSPYSRHQDHHTRSHSSHSYSYGYKRSPTPSSSSSPQVGYRSRSKSPSDQCKNNHHSRHRSNKSASSRYSSRRRGESSSSASFPYPQHANPMSSLELDRQRYMQWKREYKEWCEKYFNSFVGHFHQLPTPLLNFPPSPLPQRGDKEGSRNPSRTNSESLNRLQGKRTARTGGRSPPSQSSSDSRSPPSQSSSNSRSTPPQSPSDSRSTTSQTSSDTHSSPSHSSSDGRSTPSEDGDQPRAYQQRCAEKYGRLPITLTKGSKEVELQEGRKGDKQIITKSENPSTLKHEQKSMKEHEQGRVEESSSLDAADSTDDCRKDKRGHNTEPNACKDGTPVQDKTTASVASESVQPPVKPDKRLGKDYEKRKRSEQRNLEIEKGWRRGKYLDSRQEVERQCPEEPSKGADRVDTDKYRNPGGSKASESRSEKNRKRKEEDAERSEAQSSKCVKTNISEGPETRKSEPSALFDRKKLKKERKTWPLTNRDIWEGGIKVKPQKKISININLDGKRKEEKTKTPDSSYLETITGETKEEIEKTGNGEEEKFNRGRIEVNEKTESSRDQEGVSEEKIKPDEREARPIWLKATFRDLEGQMKEKKQLEEPDGMKASREEEVTNDERKSVRGGNEEERRVRNDSEGQEVGELVAGTQKEGESTSKENRGNRPGESKPEEELMKGETRRMRKEEEDDTTRSAMSHHDGSNTTVEDGSNYEDHQERKAVVRTLEECTQDRAADREDQLVTIQVPRSKWEKESEEEEQAEGKIKVQTDALAVFLTSSSVSVTAETPADRETEGENEKQSQREKGRDGAREMERGREREKDSTSSSSRRRVAPSSGKGRADSSFSTERDGEREKRLEMKRPKDRERGRKSERERDRQMESKRSRERGRDREGERRQRRNSPSSSHPYSYWTSHDTERRDRQRGDDQGSNKSSCCPAGKSSGGRSGELPDQNVRKPCRDTSPDLKMKDKDHSHYYQKPQYPSGNYRHHDRAAGTHHSPPSVSHTFSKGSELSKPRLSSTDWKLMQSRGRNDSNVEKEEWKQKRVDAVIKEGRGERDNQDTVVERKGGEDEADTLAGVTKWEEGRELEEEERPGCRSKSVSSSASQESGSDNRRNEWKKKQKRHKKEKRRATAELLEDEDLKKHKHKKSSRKSRDGEEEESGGEVDDHEKLYSAVF